MLSVASDGQAKQTSFRCPNCRVEHLPQNGPLPDGTYCAKCIACGYKFRFRSSVSPKSTATFSVNGKKYLVGAEAINTKLNSFIRDTVGAHGTKNMCLEGGCGSCVVAASYTDLITRRKVTKSINSCLYPVLSCDGYDIVTTEGLGSKQAGFHPIQERIAEHNGSQCGYCTPGMVINLYSLLQESSQPSAQQIEDGFDGQICRCTGYRAILDAAQSFTGDQQTLDIEDLLATCHRSLNKKQCGRGGGSGGHVASSHHQLEALYAIDALSGTAWLKPTSRDELLGILRDHAGSKIRFVVGHTSVGVYADPSFDVFVDTKAVPELNIVQIGDSLTVGANITLTAMIDLLSQASSQSGFEYCKQMADHVRKVASTPVRNLGCWAGNLMMKHAHAEFPSDLFVILEAAGASITVASPSGEEKVSPQQLVKKDMAMKVIISMTLNAKPSMLYRSYKIMPRSQFAYAYVNAAISVMLDSKCVVKGMPSLVFGGIGPNMDHAAKTEAFLVGKTLSDLGTIRQAFSILEQEIQPSSNILLPSPKYRQTTAIMLFYRFLLDILGDQVTPSLRSGATPLLRPISKGSEDYDVDKSKWPVNKPMTKLTAKLQASGEAEYVVDFPRQPGHLYAAFVLSSVGNASIDTIDPAKALNLPGVECFLSAKDIPGQNNFAQSFGLPEEVLCSGKVLYAGQPIGLIVAASQLRAQQAADLVDVTYKDVQPPILNIQDAISAGSFFPDPGPDITQGDADTAIKNAPHKISGEFDLGAQYHLTMELQSCVCIPKEDIMEVHSSTQWVDSCQTAVAGVLNTPCNKVHVSVKRVGGGYGSKISRSSWIAAACALAASATNRPVSLHLDLQTNMKMVGKRSPYHAKFEVGYDENGKLAGVKIAYYVDCGCSPNEQGIYPMVWADNDSMSEIYIIEYIMEKVARSLSKSALDVKTINLYKQDQVTPFGQKLIYCNIGDLIKQLVTSADMLKRKQEINVFNKANRWKKRGLSVVPVKWVVDWRTGQYSTTVSVYNGDGTIAVAHGGVEVGQGINTKVVQVCAYELGVDMSLVQVYPTSTLTNANSQATGGSVTSELACLAVIECCKQISSRLAPVKKSSPADISWPDLIKKAYLSGVDLTARYWTFPANAQQKGEDFKYNVYGATCSEVELDVLTGENIVTRVDMIYDCGTSINQEIDVGQLQGAFIMGLGYCFTEKIKYDPDSGENLTNSTWEYKVPLSKDIPVDFRVQLLKKAPNPVGILGSKLVGEPPMCMTCGVLFALHDAIDAARTDAGVTDDFQINVPCRVDDAHELCCTQINQLVTQTKMASHD